MRTSLKTRLAKLEGQTPSRMVSAEEQCRYWTMMLKVYGDPSDPPPKLSDFSPVSEEEFLRPLHEILDRVYSEPMPTP